jgi:hypothetical protein
MTLAIFRYKEYGGGVESIAYSAIIYPLGWNEKLVA